ncbi:putative golgin subfamily A member 6-like protein 3 [Ceratina calcarata]|uniref:Golgin subfamily A member 6-like protein 3 n=1 Tax=Ceratina calcarata TaxID=156304 RepID=A0AAJ7S109_9HYME|nr:putative golgin subfamily A member 6-like protein 3 [Ceratina calcarata]
MDTYEEKGEQTEPTRDIVNNGSSIINVRHEQATHHLGDELLGSLVVTYDGLSHNSIESICAKDKEIFEIIQKELIMEKKRCEELQMKLNNLTCSLDCLKEDSEQRAACLKGALETAEEQKNVAMDLVKRTKDQTDIIKEDREQLLSEIARLQRQISEIEDLNKNLLKERDDLTNRLQSLSEDESKRCEELEREINKMKSAVKEKEDALSKEKTELREMILELSNVINIQKRRLCEVTCICNTQQQDIHKKEKELLKKNKELRQKDEKLHEKNVQLEEAREALQTNDANKEEMEGKIEDLAKCLCEELKTCDCLKRELDTVKEQYSSELRIKEKIIEDQTRTITKQKKLLLDSQDMIQEVASEFDQMKEELHIERERNVSLQVTLGAADDKLSRVYSSPCEQCKALMNEIEYLRKEKQRAVAIAKFTYQKLQQCMKEYQKKLVCQRKQYRYMALIVERKDHEIGCLRNQLCQNGYVV